MIDTKMRPDHKKKGKALVSLPLPRVQAIMTSCPDIANINQDTVLLTAKAAELFIIKLAETAMYESGSRDITFNDVAKVIHEDLSFNFLREVIPHKITVSKYYKILQEIEAQEAKLERPISYKPDDKR